MPQNSWKNLVTKSIDGVMHNYFFFKGTKMRANSRPGETYPYMSSQFLSPETLRLNIMRKHRSTQPLSQTSLASHAPSTALRFQVQILSTQETRNDYRDCIRWWGRSSGSQEPELIGLVRKLPDLAGQKGPLLLLPTLPHPPPRPPAPLWGPDPVHWLGLWGAVYPPLVLELWLQSCSGPIFLAVLTYHMDVPVVPSWYSEFQ